MFGKSLGFLARFLAFATACLIGILFLFRLADYAGGFQKYLFAMGNWEQLIYFLVFIFVIGYFVKWLIKRQFHVLFVQNRVSRIRSRWTQFKSRFRQRP